MSNILHNLICNHIKIVISMSLILLQSSISPVKREVSIVVLWEHYTMKGSAPLWSSTLLTGVLQGGTLQYARD